jgi:prepilin-type N-terminal cleavage/methylation domain-containing protein
MNTNNNNTNRQAQLAFTLIELLVVITIMGLVASMVLVGGKYASVKKKEIAVQAEREKLQLMIENYHAKLNFYPPDNGNLASINPSKVTPTSSQYEGYTTANPLIYELTGGTNTNGYAVVFNSNGLNLGSYSSTFGRSGLANCDTTDPQNFFKPPPSPQEYANYLNTTLSVLVVPAVLSNNMTNYWHYDASSPNRHNQNSYDLWAEFSIGSKSGQLVIETNGNW